VNLLRNGPDRYGSASVALHWFMLLLLAAVYACIELHELFPKGSAARETLKALHYSLGLSVLVLAAVRVVVRVLAGPAPPIAPPPGAWERRAAMAVQVALYGLMVGLPLAGWALLSAEGASVTLFGLELPSLVGRDPALGEWLEDAHELAGRIGYGLIALHAAAAVFHHCVRRDNVLRRMAPRVA
jgi:cytochrome b561